MVAEVLQWGIAGGLSIVQAEEKFIVYNDNDAFAISIGEDMMVASTETHQVYFGKITGVDFKCDETSIRIDNIVRIPITSIAYMGSTSREVVGYKVRRPVG